MPKMYGQTKKIDKTYFVANFMWKIVNVLSNHLTCLEISIKNLKTCSNFWLLHRKRVTNESFEKNINENYRIKLASFLDILTKKENFEK